MNETALTLAKLLFDQRLIQNQFRSAFVEAMIEPYLARGSWRYCGGNWSGWDFEHKRGTRLELKQSAAWQTWDPFKQAASGLPPKPGPGIFDIGLRTGWFDETGAVWRKLPEPGRPAHVYVLHGTTSTGTLRTIATLINGNSSSSPLQICRRARKHYVLANYVNSQASSAPSPDRTVWRTSWLLTRSG